MFVRLQGLRLAVDKESSRYRDNQKQLLTRLKDKQPTDLNGIDELLEVEDVAPGD